VRIDFDCWRQSVESTVRVAEVAAGVRELLAAIDRGELMCSAAYRNRLQGAALALDALARGAAGTAPTD